MGGALATIAAGALLTVIFPYSFSKADFLKEQRNERKRSFDMDRFDTLVASLPLNALLTLLLDCVIRIVYRTVNNNY